VLRTERRGLALKPVSALNALALTEPFGLHPNSPAYPGKRLEDCWRCIVAFVWLPLSIREESAVETGAPERDGDSQFDPPRGKNSPDTGNASTSLRAGIKEYATVKSNLRQVRRWIFLNQH
jgi:hypothetical protein